MWKIKESEEEDTGASFPNPSEETGTYTVHKISRAAVKGKKKKHEREWAEGKKAEMMLKKK